ASPVWPSSGIAVAALLLGGNRLWPGVWLGATLVNLTVETSLASALTIGTGNTLEAVIGAILIRRFGGNFPSFSPARGVFGVVAAAAISGTVAATVAMMALTTGHQLSAAQVLSNWWTWWQGDVSGIIIVAPLILSWATRSQVDWSGPKIAEATCFALLLLVV